MKVWLTGIAFRLSTAVHHQFDLHGTWFIFSLFCEDVTRLTYLQLQVI